ncbi:MAG: carboxymuconolactone decarboxylase family protein [Chloroflexi bacterium]|nr:carboxymuconolactone decarboxylase family protein [Chloroflexota bacterium]
MARVPFVDANTAPQEVSEVFQKLESRGAKVINLYRTMGHSKAALLPFIKLGNSLLTGAKLDSKLREMAILRIAVLLGSKYEWQQHAPLARQVGVGESQLAGLAHWEDSPAFDEKEKAVLAYVDEVTRSVEVGDSEWTANKRFLDHTEIVELTLSIGFWGLVARFLVPLKIDMEEGDGTSGGDLLGRSSG